MTALVGGVGALILGIILLIIWWGNFLVVLSGAIPVLLLHGFLNARANGVIEMLEHETAELLAEHGREGG